MTGARYERLVSLCDRAVTMPDAEREAWLRSVCPDDPQLVGEALEMLAHDQAQSDLDGSALPDGANVGDWLDRQRQDERLEPSFPEQIGSYRILSLLGEGGMSIVYRAQQESPRREVALKVLRDIQASPRRMRRLRAEAETLAKLRRPGVAQVYEAGAADVGGFSIVYIAMELVDGDRLDHYVNRRGLDIRSRVELMTRVCEAIEEAHQAGVVHRDLKPANILVEERDGRGVPKIVDFGVARILGDAQPDVMRMTTRRELVGTLPYMSPEQIAGDMRAVDTRTDVYALGVILYELLTGCFPLDLGTDTVTRALERIRTERPAPMSACDPALPTDLGAIAAKALEKDPSMRYASTGAMRDDLERFLDGRPVLARAPSAAYVLRKLISRHRIAAMLILLAAGAISLGGAGATIGMLRYQAIARRLQAEQLASKQSAAFLVTDVVRQLDSVAGSKSIKQVMLPRLRQRIEELLNTSPNDETLLSIDAKVLDEMSDLDLEARMLEEALMCRRRVLDLRRSLLAQLPDDPDRLSDVSIALVKIGDIANERSDYDEALTWYTRAFEIDERLAREHPDSRRFADNLSWSYNRMAFNAQARGELTDALQWLKLRIDLAQTLVNRFPDNITAIRGLIDAQNGIANIFQKQNDLGKTKEASQRLESAMSLAEDLLARAPNNPFVIDVRLMVAIDLANRRFQSGRIADAESILQSIRPLAERFLKLESGAPPIVRMITLLDALSRTTANPAIRLDLAVRAVDILHERWGDSPTTPPQAQWFVSVHETYSNRLFEAGDLDAAVEQVRLALAYAIKGRDLSPAPAVSPDGSDRFPSIKALEDQLETILLASASRAAPASVEH